MSSSFRDTYMDICGLDSHTFVTCVFFSLFNKLHKGYFDLFMLCYYYLLFFFFY
jgi:hypothetical protein